MLTFTLKVFLVRIVDLATLGVVSELELFASTTLFLSRESIRLALLRAAPTSKSHQKSTNLAYLSLAIGTFAIAFYLVYSGITGCLLVYSLATWVELAAEPMYIQLQTQMMYGARTRIEATAAISQCLTTVVICLFAMGNAGVSIEHGVLAYSIAQLVFSVVLFAGYVSQTGLLFFASVDGGWFDPLLLQISFSFIGQMVLKHLLTVGDQIMMIWFGVSHLQKGSYRLVNDLGSLVARIVFQPIEETLRTYFGQSLGSGQPKKEVRKESQKLLQIACRLNVVLAIYFVFFATNYTDLLLYLLYSKRDAGTSTILGIYCLYVPVMGINGVTEAFVQAVGDANMLKLQGFYMFACWIAFTFISASLVTFGFGLSGLIIANIVNLGMRILFSIWCIRNYFGEFSVSDFFGIGDYKVWFLFACSWGLTRYTSTFNGGLTHQALHLFLGVVCFLHVSSRLYFSELDRTMTQLQKYHGISKQD